jgi:hypothetical protein
VIALAAVHTTGINWASVAAIVSLVVVIMTSVLTVLARYIGAKVTAAIDKFRIEAFEPLEGRVTVVETIVGVLRPGPGPGPGGRGRRHRRV